MYPFRSAHSVSMRSAILGITWGNLMTKYWYYSVAFCKWIPCSYLNYLLFKKIGGTLVSKGKDNA